MPLRGRPHDSLAHYDAAARAKGVRVSRNLDLPVSDEPGHGIDLSCIAATVGR